MATISLPSNFLSRMETMLKEEYPAFLKSYDAENHLGLRVNTLKLSKEEFLALSPFTLEPISWCDSGFYYKADERPGKHPFHEAGFYYLQEPSAMAAAEILDPLPGETVLDLCAAPGGKSTHIAAKMQDTGLLVSNEIHPRRAQILAQNIERCGISHTVVLNESPQSLSKKFPEFFDRILTDAPCSGEGMFRKNPEAILEWSAEQVQVCAARQQDILEEAHRMLKPGGTLVYSTCTFAPAENENVIDTFIKKHPEYSIESAHICPQFSPGNPAFIHSSSPELEKTCRLWPHKLAGEGHFIAKLKKGGAASRKKSNDLSQAPETALKDYRQFMDESLTIQPKGRLILFGSELYAVPTLCPDLDGIRVMRAGLHLGTCKKNRFEPSHALALWLKPSQVQRQKTLISSEEIYDYWKGKSLPAASPKGWTLVTIDGYSFGWGKVSNDMLKNHYPKGKRLVDR